MVLDATILDRLAVRDFLLGLANDLLRPYWTQSSYYAAVRHLKRSRLRGGLGSQSAALAVMMPLSRFTGNLVATGTLRSARKQLAVLPDDTERGDAAACAVAVQAGTILTFRLPPVKFRNLTVEVRGGAPRTVTFELVDPYLTNLYEQMPSDEKSELLLRITSQARLSPSTQVSDSRGEVQTLLRRLAGQGLHRFVRRLRQEFRSRAT